MAKILSGNGHLRVMLDKSYIHDNVVKTMRQILKEMPENPSKSISDGMINYNRRTFSRKDYAEQKIYIQKLKSQRLYWINELLVPRTIFDAVVGTITSDVNAPKVAA